ncbi:MAG: Rpn family recombination-promoting nuclease/putative transposase [Acetatifactor sp.]|nr:Rpn family recombination-promoting nuclease/putative transposase [Acetatifactor sp.]MDE7113234.1 Rpn family recombination-promoting nuclease/putative transposase [Acetatifactor sp.]
MAHKKFQDLNLSDAYLFAAALQDAEVCRKTLELLLGRDVESVTVHAEHSLLYSSECRSIRLDVYSRDETGYHYNLEMQGENEGNLPRRSRYHQAQMDVTSLRPGEDFNELRPNYIIFICCFDPFGEGLYRYTFTNKCSETGQELGDGTTKIFLNTKGRNPVNVPDSLIHFLAYLENSTAECADERDDAVRQIHSRVTEVKRDRTWESRYMRFEELLQKERRKGKNEGREETQARMQELIRRMLADGAQEELAGLAEKDFLEAMYQRYGL